MYAYVCVNVCLIIEVDKPKGLCEMRRLRFRDRGGNGDLSDPDAYELGYFVETVGGGGGVWFHV